MTYSAHITVCNFTFLLIVTLQFKKKNSSCSWQEGQFLLPAVDLKTPFFCVFSVKKYCVNSWPLSGIEPSASQTPFAVCDGWGMWEAEEPLARAAQLGPPREGETGRTAPRPQTRGTAEMLHLTRSKVTIRQPQLSSPGVNTTKTALGLS